MLVLIGVFATGILIANGNINPRDLGAVDGINIKVFGSNFVLPDFQGLQASLNYQKVEQLGNWLSSSYQELKFDFLTKVTALMADQAKAPNPNDDSEDYPPELNSWIQDQVESQVEAPLKATETKPEKVPTTAQPAVDSSIEIEPSFRPDDNGPNPIHT